MQDIDMSLTVRSAGRPGMDGSEVLHLKGEVDVATAPILQERLASALEGGARTVVLDMSALRFLDTSGLSVIARAAGSLEERDREMVVRSPSAAVRRTFEITGLDTVVRIS